MKKLAVFASGTGSNFDAIADAIDKGELNAMITLVVVDQPQALVIEKARKRNIETFVFSAKAYESKAAYEKEIVSLCRKKEIDLIVLAGYMRILSEVLLTAYANKIINIHPSLLPAFKGKDAIGQAIDYKVKVMGVSIHYVDQTLDGGAIIAQKAFEVQEHFTREEITKRIHEIEHQLYPKTIKTLLEE